jgi:ubiquitin carboxyl-terminal hydrolase 34
MWGWGKFNRENSQNAYILVYEKVVKDPIELIFDCRDQIGDLEVLSSTEQEDGKLRVKLDYYGIKPFVPEPLKQMVVADNKQLFLERTIFDQDLLQFILNLTDDAMKQLNESEPTFSKINLISLLIKFSFDLIAHAYDTSLLEQYYERLKKLLEQNKDLSYEFLRDLYLEKPSRVPELLL